MIAAMKGAGVTTVPDVRRPALPDPHHHRGHTARATSPSGSSPASGLVRHDRRRPPLRPAPVAPRVRHLAAVGHVDERRRLGRLPRVPPRHAGHEAGRRGRAYQHLPRAESRRCSPAFTWPGPKLTADTFAQGMFNYPQHRRPAGRPARVPHARSSRPRSRTSSRSTTTATRRDRRTRAAGQRA